MPCVHPSLTAACAHVGGVGQGEGALHGQGRSPPSCRFCPKPDLGRPQLTEGVAEIGPSTGGSMSVR